MRGFLLLAALLAAVHSAPYERERRLLGRERPLAFGVGVVFGPEGDGGSPRFRHRNELLLRALRRSGATLVRMGISWYDCERKRGVYDFSSVDWVVDALEREGVEILCVLCTTPEWASGVTEEQKEVFRELGMENLIGVLPPEDEYVQDFSHFARTVAERYRGRIRLYEFWNEPDGMGMPRLEGAPGSWFVRFGGDPALYTRWLCAAYRSLKAGDPDCTVAVGGLEARPRTAFFEGMLAAGAAGHFDALALHPYARPETGWRLDWDWVDAHRRLLVEAGLAEVPIWITEWGWATDAGGSEVDEALRVTLIDESFAAMARRPYVAVAVHHTLNDWGNPEAPSTMGLCDFWINPRPSFGRFAWWAAGARAARRSQ